jgi:hypothetical protein
MDAAVAEWLQTKHRWLRKWFWLIYRRTSSVPLAAMEPAGAVVELSQLPPPDTYRCLCAVVTFGALPLASFPSSFTFMGRRPR